MGLIFLIVIIVIAAAAVGGVYNGLVRNRLLVKEASSGIDVQLKRRWDLIPKVVDTVKGYAQHEKSLMEKVTSMRSQMVSGASLADRGKAETELSATLKSIFALAEAYPDLKANRNFIQLQTTLSEIEDQIQMSRRYYNGTVRDYNMMCQQFPSGLVAGAFGFRPEPFFELEYATQRQSPDVKFD
ncbi:MAG: LemA family protein [Candidatus Omnitrophica bacterium]|nr:LemA family protein [Candidatus Omnitrophota bacterium]